VFVLFLQVYKQTNKLTLEHCLKYTMILKTLTVTNMTVYLVF